MTDLPHDPLDELASAHLDGLTSIEEGRRVEGDPALVDRVARLRAARDAVRLDDVPVDAERRERAIVTALAAADGAGVASLDEARRRRARTWFRIAGAAAAVALAIVVVPQLTGDDGKDDATTLAAGDAREKRASTTTIAALAPDADAGGTSAAASGPSEATDEAAASLAGLPDYGTFTDLDALALAVRDQLPNGPTALDSDPSAERDACLTTVRAELAQRPGFEALVGVARVGTQDVVLVVHPEPDPAPASTSTPVLHVIAVEGCTPLLTRAI